MSADEGHEIDAREFQIAKWNEVFVYVRLCFLATAGRVKAVRPSLPLNQRKVYIRVHMHELTYACNRNSESDVEKKTKSVKLMLKAHSYMVVTYEEELWPGKVLEVKNNGAVVSCIVSHMRSEIDIARVTLIFPVSAIIFFNMIIIKHVMSDVHATPVDKREELIVRIYDAFDQIRHSLVMFGSTVRETDYMPVTKATFVSRLDPGFLLEKSIVKLAEENDAVEMCTRILPFPRYFN
ncbi:hypothetical protein ANN_24405 [Periplaneta americana]|uniref:Uncharacterized protein n=1 Tax=Periplaneta americana TaxID=6978 RepID=A0ABQ8S3Q4_PERAM|nr:hypothetical protein ANN_24405 [Periplaneta americana]